MRKNLLLPCATLALMAAGLAHADIIMTTQAALAPNAFGSPSFSGWRDNAITALRTGAQTVGNPAADPTGYQAVGGVLGAKDNIVTSFPSWMGSANPSGDFGPAFANELGNRLHIGLHVNGNGAQFSLSELQFEMFSTDPGDVLGWASSFDATDSYTASRVGLIHGPSGDILITSGSATQLVDELFYAGPGNALPNGDVPGAYNCPGSGQGTIDCIAAFQASIMPYSVYTTFRLVDGGNNLLAATTNEVDFGVPEPATWALMGAGLLALATRARIASGQTESNGALPDESRTGSGSAPRPVL